MNEAYISLGSNMGDKEETLRHAVQLLQQHPAIMVVKLSSIYETDPVGYTDQDVFLNMVILVHTPLAAQELLEECQKVEQALKRVRVIRWGPRTIDLDILLYNHDNIETETLIVPHTRMHERAFVLVPLVEIAPELKHPTIGVAFQALLEQVGKEGVRRWKIATDLSGFILSKGSKDSLS
ncbi:2-amino-4-hydroxy-6-hydroxymethyldihydropteridine diphosphokinase [Rummeliibacillus suwonensis]|uniref:2-amino-4-hydroxy-6- hydroxymethyldihydropteridine diphosphokinase n=1 Tax=Rummeliibacillus suwonensis TaxID=1306154 RepID=UPI0011B6ACFD|nr:2-amino-4-hydroxy-6-hydroxymethyldihydropteridine diphosphokinase [Rummeliibacillus suwonensis]